VEVLSDSTAGMDRTETFAAYRRLASLREYVLISQRERRIEIASASSFGSQGEPRDRLAGAVSP
jgi:Uma2 family endonuclease